jgi:hypothetical protein
MALVRRSNANPKEYAHLAAMVRGSGGGEASRATLLSGSDNKVDYFPGGQHTPRDTPTLDNDNNALTSKNDKCCLA